MCSGNKSPLRAFFRSFRYAGQGLALCWRERNFRFHLVAAVYVSALAPHFLRSAGEWCALVLTMASVIGAEVLNTAVEYVVDLVCPERDERARRAKDAAAGAVLVFAVAAVVVAVVLFGRAEGWTALWALWQTRWWRPLVLGLSLIPAAVVVFHR